MWNSLFARRWAEVYAHISSQINQHVHHEGLVMHIWMSVQSFPVIFRTDHSRLIGPNK